MPGFKKGDFKIDLDQNVLTISAEKHNEKKEKIDRFEKKEILYHSFSRSFTLPQIANSKKIDVKYHNGILILCIPKKEEAKLISKREIKVA